DGPGVANGRVDLPRVADDPSVRHQPRAVGVAEGRHPLGVEPGESRAEGGALAEDGDPSKAGLEGLEGDPLVEGDLAVDRHTPLVVVVGEVLGRRPGPGAAQPPVRTDEQSGGVDVGHVDVVRLGADSSIRSSASPKSLAVARSEIGAASRPRVSGRGTISSRQTPSVPPASAAARATSAKPRNTLPVFRTANRAAPSAGGSPRTRSMVSRNPTGPTPVKPANPHPSRTGGGSVRIEVSGIQRPYA